MPESAQNAIAASLAHQMATALALRQLNHDQIKLAHCSRYPPCQPPSSMLRNCVSACDMRFEFTFSSSAISARAVT